MKRRWSSTAQKKKVTVRSGGRRKRNRKMSCRAHVCTTLLYALSLCGVCDLVVGFAFLHAWSVSSVFFVLMCWVFFPFLFVCCLKGFFFWCRGAGERYCSFPSFSDFFLFLLTEGSTIFRALSRNNKPKKETQGLNFPFATCFSHPQPLAWPLFFLFFFFLLSCGAVVVLALESGTRQSAWQREHPSWQDSHTHTQIGRASCGKECRSRLSP